jgi:hypothetical protein
MLHYTAVSQVPCVKFYYSNHRPQRVALFNFYFSARRSLCACTLAAPTRATPRMTWRAVARSATLEMRCMMPAFARDRPPSSLLNPSLRWCCAAMLSEILPIKQ